MAYFCTILCNFSLNQYICEYKRYNMSDMKLAAGILSFIILVSVNTGMSADNIRRISSREGISNNSVLSLGQDSDGAVWFGSCDGLDRWDGITAENYPGKWSGMQELSGNLIEEIVPTSDSLFWIRTNYGLDLFGRQGVMAGFGQFQGMYRIAARHSSEILVLTADSRLYGWSRAGKRFEEIFRPDFLRMQDVLSMSVDGSEDLLWTVTRNGLYASSMSLPSDGGALTVSDTCAFRMAGEFAGAFQDTEGFFIVDRGGFLHFFDTVSCTLVFMYDLSSEIASKGVVSDIVRDGDDLMVAFLYNGVVRLEKVVRGGRHYYSPHRLDISCGVFSLLKDRNQDIVWIGTDGQGVMMYAHDPITFTSYTFDKLPYSLSKPVRALELDRRGTLWVATKGEGILVVEDFRNQDRITGDNSFLLGQSNSGLASETVYAIEESSRGLMWIGTEGYGINWWSYKDHRIHALGGTVPEDLRYVHGILEVSRDTLYVATVGCGAYRLIIGGEDDSPRIEDWELLDFGEEFRENSFFFTVCRDSDGAVLFGNRGAGLVRYDPRTGTSRTFTFSDGRADIADDVWAVCRASDGSLWVGTSWGMFDAGSGAAGFCPVRNTVHCIAEDAHGNLWASTNRGLVKYSLKDRTTVTYGYSYGLNTIEYSDGAVFADTLADVLMFGGIDGFVTVSQEPYSMKGYSPPVQFRTARIGDRSVMIDPSPGHSGLPELSVPPGGRLYSVDVAALDYIDGSNYVYSYRFGTKEQWIETPHRISTGVLSPGRYTLYVKYRNQVTGYESPEYGMRIRVIPPWYGSVAARITYMFLVLGMLSASLLVVYRRRRAKEEERQRHLEAARREEVLESKVRLFGTIARELSAPLTMISGPCHQIMRYGRSDGFIRSHSEQIMRQSYKIFDMLTMFRDFSEPGNIDPRLFSVSDVVEKVTSTYRNIAETNGIGLSIKIPRRLIWCTDPSGIVSVVNIMLATAVSHTRAGGAVEFTVSSSASGLKIAVSYEDTSFRPDDVTAFRDRYTIMDRLNAGHSGDAFRNDIRLAACSSIVSRLGGSMEPEASGNEVSFVVTLPFMNRESAAEESGKESVEYGGADSIPYGAGLERETLRQFDDVPGGRMMYIAGRDAEMMNFVADLFAGEYNIRMFRTVSAVRDAIAVTHPDIMLLENMYSGTDFLDLVHSVKTDRVTSHIPVILLGTDAGEEDRLRSVESGADINISLPFDVRYLKAVVSQLLSRMRSLQDYWQSGLSAYEFTGGRKLHREDREFMDRLFRIINENISDAGITTSGIAGKMGMSLRNLYYRLDGLLTVTPSNIIKEYRIRYAARLLTTSSLSVDQIIDRCGFANRGTFFRNFSARYGTTPKAYRQTNSGIGSEQEAQ